jgi:hypothetical protein
MPRNYNTNGDQHGATGAGRAYTPQVMPWERDDDDASVASRRDFARDDHNARQFDRNEARQEGESGDGDVWNRQDLQPAYEVPVAGDDDHREPGRDNNDRSFARDTTADTQDPERLGYGREPGSDRQWDDRAWDRDNGVHKTSPGEQLRDVVEGDDDRRDARDFGRMNDGLSDRKH